MLRAAAAVALAHMREMEHALRSAAPLDAVEAAWFSDGLQASNACLEFIGRAQTLMAQARRRCLWGKP